jgi:hypothetical protein
MEIVTPKAIRRSTRLRVEIPLTMTSMDRRNPYSAACVALVVSPQGCGIRATRGLPVETPVLLSDLPGGGSTSGYVANCLPVGTAGEYFLIGVSLYNHANVWGVANPPADWTSGSASANASSGASIADSANGKSVWPYNRFSSEGVAHPVRSHPVKIN